MPPEMDASVETPLPRALVLNYISSGSSPTRVRRIAAMGLPKIATPFNLILGRPIPLAQSSFEYRGAGAGRGKGSNLIIGMIGLYLMAQSLWNIYLAFTGPGRGMFGFPPIYRLVLWAFMDSPVTVTVSRGIGDGVYLLFLSFRRSPVATNSPAAFAMEQRSRCGNDLGFIRGGRDLSVHRLGNRGRHQRTPSNCYGCWHPPSPSC